MNATKNEVAEKAIRSAQELVYYLEKMKNMEAIESRANDSIQEICVILAKEIENGKKIEGIMEMLEKKILITLIARGHDTSKKLARVMQKSDCAMRQMLMTRKLKLSQIKDLS